MFLEAGKQYNKMGGFLTPIPSGSASPVGSGFVSWETSTAISIQFDTIDSLEALPNQLELLSEKSTTPIESLSVKEIYANKAFKTGNRLEFDTRNLPHGTYYVRVINRR